MIARRTWLATICLMVFVFSAWLVVDYPIAKLPIAIAATPAKTRVINFTDLNEAFRGAKFWNGADGAMTVRLSPSRTLWLFGDTWVKTSSSSGEPRKMINNSVAIESYMFDEKLECGLLDQQFSKSPDILHIGNLHWSYWFGEPENPKSVFAPKEDGVWYWPGCGAVYGDKLYLILKKIRKKDDPNPLFQFDWFGEDLVIVNNPMEPPSQWFYTIHPLGNSSHEIQYGLACTTDDKFFYSACYLQETPAAPKKTILARISLGRLSNKHLTNWEYCSQNSRSTEGAWNADSHKATDIVPDGGPEMSLFFEKGTNCYIAVYQPPFSPKVNLRAARKIEGPWSEPLTIFKVPQIRLGDGQPNALIYAGKAHEHLTVGSGIGFTYCANPGGLEAHEKNPEVYFPTARFQPITRQTLPNLLHAASKRKPEQ